VSKRIAEGRRLLIVPLLVPFGGIEHDAPFGSRPRLVLAMTDNR
jgi:hypothetical protein